MEISDVRVKLLSDSADRLKAVCTITFDEEFVVRDVKVVDGVNGLFVAMPSRKLTVHCPQCRYKNNLRSRYCNECGGKLPANQMPADPDGKARLHRDIAHPITPACREMIQQRVIEAYELEVDKPRVEEEEMEHSNVVETDVEPAVYDPDAEPAEEEEETQPFVETRGESKSSSFSDYGSLIAGLKGGPRSQPADRRPQSDSGRDNRRRDEPRERRPSGPSNTGRRSDNRPRPAERPAAPSRPERPAPRTPQPRKSLAEYLGETEPQEVKEVPVRAPVAPPASKPAVPKPAVPKPAVVKPAAVAPAAPPPVTPDDEGDAFGQGIL